MHRAPVWYGPFCYGRLAAAPCVDQTMRRLLARSLVRLVRSSNPSYLGLLLYYFLLFSHLLSPSLTPFPALSSQAIAIASNNPLLVGPTLRFSTVNDQAGHADQTPAKDAPACIDTPASTAVATMWTWSACGGARCLKRLGSRLPSLFPLL